MALDMYFTSKKQHYIDIFFSKICSVLRGVLEKGSKSFPHLLFVPLGRRFEINRNPKSGILSSLPQNRNGVARACCLFVLSRFQSNLEIWKLKGAKDLNLRKAHKVTDIEVN